MESPSVPLAPVGGGGPASAVTEGRLAPPKHIPVNGRPIKLRWLQQIIWSALAANVGALIIAGLYYLITQVNWHIAAFTLSISWAHIHWHFGGWKLFYLKHQWDNLFSYRTWPQDRHDVRGLYESVLATLLVRSLLAKWEKARGKRVGWFRLITAPMLLIVAAAPLLVAGIYVVNYGLPKLWHLAFHHRHLGNPVHFPHSWSWLGTYLTQWGKWEIIIVGVLVGLVIHRLYAPIGNTVQAFFVDRQVDKTRDARAAGDTRADRHRPRWPLPPVFREHYAWIMDNDLPVPDRHRSLKAAAWTLSFVLFALFAIGVVARYLLPKHGIG